MGKSSSPPAAPDYTAAANATAAGNRINQVTPYGSMTYSSSGNDASGNPQYTQTVNLAPDQQKLLDQQNKISLGLGSTMDQGLGYVQNALATPFDTSKLPAQQINPGQTAQDAIMARLNPQFDRRQSALETQLANQGIGRGTEAWSNGMTDLNNARNDATSQAAMQGISVGDQARQQALQEQSFLRNEPVNMLNAVRSGAQVTGPQFSATPQGANYLGAAQSQYQADLGGYNAQQAGNNNMMSGLMGMGGAFLGSPTGSALIGKAFGLK